MREITLSWLNGGKPIKLKSMPLAGHRALEELKRRYTKYIYLTQRGRALWLMEAILMTRKVLESRGVEPAKEALESSLAAFLSEHEAKAFTWPVEAFKENLEAWVSDHVYKQFNVKDEASAEKALREAAGALEKDLAGLDGAGRDYFIEAGLTELYWNLYGQVKSILTAEGEKVLKWGREHLDETLETLSQVASIEDLAAIRAANRPENPRPVSSEDFALKSEEDTEKNS